MLATNNYDYFERGGQTVLPNVTNRSDVEFPDGASEKRDCPGIRARKQDGKKNKKSDKKWYCLGEIDNKSGFSINTKKGGLLSVRGWAGPVGRRLAAPSR